MSSRTEVPGPVEDAQARANRRMWARSELVRGYANRTLRPPEVVLLVRYRDDLSGRVLELGCGAGRVTGYLAQMADHVRAIDVSPAMVDECRRRYPGVGVEQRDLRDLGVLGGGPYTAVVAAYSVVDVLGDAARRELLESARRLLAPGGLLVFSSHNLDAPPGRLSITRGGLLRLPIALARLPRYAFNHLRTRRFERREPGYAILNDVSHDYQGLHYYIRRDDQERQLSEHGLALVECLDGDARTVPAGTRSASPELHYVARAG